MRHYGLLDKAALNFASWCDKQGEFVGIIYWITVVFGLLAIVWFGFIWALRSLFSSKEGFIEWVTTIWRELSANRNKGVFIGSKWVPDAARVRHTHIVGATGSGKSVLLENLIFADIERGLGMVIIDPKGDRAFLERVRRVSRLHGRIQDLKVLSSDPDVKSHVWNPCALGSPSELQSKFYNAAVYAEPHYAKHCERALLRAFSDLHAKTGTAGFNLRHLVEKLEVLSDHGKDKNTEGLFLDLHNLVESEWGPLLAAGNESGKDQPELSLWEIVDQGGILFVSLPTEAKAVQSQRVGRLLLQELLLISGARKRIHGIDKRLPFSVYIDEFDAFATPSFTTLVNKGRSSNFMIHMAHQTLSDLRKIDEHFTGQIMGNCNVRFVFRQDDPDDAETWSRFFGTKLSVKENHRTDGGFRSGEGSEREVHEFRVSPDTIKELPTGQCIFSMKSPSQLKRLKVPMLAYGSSHREAPESSESRPIQRGIGRDISLQPQLKLADKFRA